MSNVGALQRKARRKHRKVKVNNLYFKSLGTSANMFVAAYNSSSSKIAECSSKIKIHKITHFPLKGNKGISEAKLILTWKKNQVPRHVSDSSSGGGRARPPSGLFPFSGGGGGGC